MLDQEIEERLTCTALDTHYGKWQAVHFGCCVMLSRVEWFERVFASLVGECVLLLSRGRIECTVDEVRLVARIQ